MLRDSLSRTAPINSDGGEGQRPCAFLPFADPHAAYLECADPIHSTVRRVFESRICILGPEVEAFELEFAS